ncbi:Na+ H+ antiporter family protein [Secundilactobacillus odoratitofui DSM 19909 = JCM 15043]|uniref:Na+ H+ antiporter family protein n=2 Tax=Secundilactobacillus odoratitofui TaxID=480930 RepID=A0A0R1LNZ2_9LACO|nr:Na+/H+ antiporter NhaC family protein [Secundilactobacillus odoratitofui]KRK97573.1 Na+ H+ antiporter family protein [Secundilactobacillus odoratitofui DSM 19909 = JCM 15043]
MKSDKQAPQGNFIGLVPLIFFLVLYISSGLLTGSFDNMPLLVAMMLASVVAFLLKGDHREDTFSDKLTIFFKGAGQETMILMIIIFMLAGAFYYVTKSMHAVQTITNIGLTYLPKSFLVPGVFILGCILSFAMGTSMGTVAALMPIAASIAQIAHINMALMAGVVVSGAMFGDDLSLISGSAIVSAKTQGVTIFEKFKTNTIMVIPAVLITIALLMTVSVGHANLSGLGAIHWIKILPYVVVIVLSFMNLNVLVVLLMGIVTAIAIGMGYGDFDFIGALDAVHKGMLSMADISFISIVVGGLAQLMHHMGGISWLLNKITKHANGALGGKFAIAFLILLLDLITTNNTVSIMIAGPIAKDLSDTYHISKSYTASILDIFSCVGQGIIPYGGQLLMAAAIAQVSAASIVPYSWYCIVLGIVSIVFLVSRFSPKDRRLQAI